MIQKEILKTIKSYQTIIIHHHLHPDADCIGSQLGLKYIIQESFPDKNVYAVGNHSESTEFLGSLDVITDDVYNHALVIIVDVGDKHRVDDNRFLNGDKLIKIDHHPKTDEFADIEWVDTTYASATEMIVDLYVKNKEQLVMTEVAARVLYAGTITDTGRYYYNSVTDRTLRYGAELYQFNFDKQRLYANLYHQSLAEVKFKGYVLNNFINTENGLGYMKLDNDLLNQFQLSAEYASSQVNILSNIKEVMMWIFFIEYKENGQIRVEFRSRGPVCNQLAKKYGGGGHAFASGALVDSWDIVEKIIIDAEELCMNFNQ